MKAKTLDLNSKVFTIGQVAKICSVAPRTATKWFDSGELRGYRLPLSRDRRVKRSDLIEFMAKHGMSLVDESLATTIAMQDLAAQTKADVQ